MKTTTCPMCRGEAIVYASGLSAECQTCGHRFRTSQGRAFDDALRTIIDAIFLPARWMLDRTRR